MTDISGREILKPQNRAGQKKIETLLFLCRLPHLTYSVVFVLVSIMIMHQLSFFPFLVLFSFIRFLFFSFSLLIDVLDLINGST